MFTNFNYGDKMKTIFILFVLFNFTFAQNYNIEKLKGEIKFILPELNNWQTVNTKSSVSENTIVSAEDNSSARITGPGLNFLLKDGAALSISSLKKMSLDELILALALDKVMSAPRKKNNEKSDATSVYGNNLSSSNNAIILSNDFGWKRIKGAKQLAENGFIESSIITARDIFRKYPSTGKDPSTRIYFADLLYYKKLYDEALEEYNSIKKLNLSNQQKDDVDNKINSINKLLLKK